MRLLPRSLFGRLVLILLAGLLLAQLLSTAISLDERNQVITQATGIQVAQRIADAVALLDSSNANERRAMAGRLSAPPLLITLDRPEMALPTNGAGVVAAMFESLLHHFVGDDLPIHVIGAAHDIEGSPAVLPAWRQGASMGAARFGHAMHHAHMSAFSAVVQVRLRDGTWATFESRQPQDAFIAPYRMLMVLAVLLVAVLIVSLVAVRWVTQPLLALGDAAEALGKDIHRSPLPETGPAEVRRAARAFNEMQQRLTGYLRDRTRALAAMSHDLKTPITRMRLRAELLEDASVRAKFEEDLDAMESMVAETLSYMRGTENQEPMQRVDVNSMLESLWANFAEAGKEVRIEGTVGDPYLGRAQLLKRCLTNIVDNAVRYGTRASIIVEDSAEQLRIRIRDNGPGIPDDEIERVFEPFYRREASRSRDTGGTGLGLTIARDIARSHGGDLKLANRAEGGLEATLVLPRSSEL